MGEHSLSARMQQKIDTAANWAKATNFVPKKGEIIVYSDGGGVGVPKIKVGDGTTVVGDLNFTGSSGSTSLSTLTLNGNSYNGSAAVTLSSQQLGVPSAFIAKSVSALDCNNEKIGRVLSSSAANSLINGPAEIGSTGAGMLWNIPLSAPTSSINEAGTQQKLYQIFVYDSGKVYLRKNSSNDTATWTYGTWEKLLTDVNITADNIQSALGYAPVTPSALAAKQDALTDADRQSITKTGMTTGPAWTATEQKAARERMGIDKPYELIEEFDLSEASTFERTEEPDGTPFSFIDIITQIIAPKNTSLTTGSFFAQAKNIAGNFINVGRGYMSGKSSGDNRMGYVQRTRIRHGYWESAWGDWETNLSVLNFNSADVYQYWLKYKESEYKAINKIYETTVLPAGTHIRIFGVRA